MRIVRGAVQPALGQKSLQNFRRSPQPATRADELRAAVAPQPGALPGCVYGLRVYRPVPQAHVAFLEMTLGNELRMVAGSDIATADLPGTLREALCHAFILPHDNVVVSLAPGASSVRIVGLQDRVRNSRVADIAALQNFQKVMLANAARLAGGVENLSPVSGQRIAPNHGTIYYELQPGEKRLRVGFHLDFQQTTGAINSKVYHAKVGVCEYGRDIWEGVDVQALATIAVMRLHGDFNRLGRDEGRETIVTLEHVLERSTEDFRLEFHPSRSEFYVLPPA